MPDEPSERARCQRVRNREPAPGGLKAAWGNVVGMSGRSFGAQKNAAQESRGSRVANCGVDYTIAVLSLNKRPPTNRPAAAVGTPARDRR